MNLTTRFQARLALGHKLLVPYLCAGFPEPDLTLPLLEALADAGADAIELGIPFSDPLMDGPVIQAASSRALALGMTLDRALAIAETFKARRDTPLLLMSSINPLFRMGPNAFAERAKAAGIAGCIIPDLPMELQFMLPGAPPMVQLLSPNTPKPRMDALSNTAAPFLYAISVMGVTGTRHALPDYTLPFLRRAKEAAKRPVLAGFGISDTSQACELAAACDGVILGSSLLRALLEDGGSCEDPTLFVQRAKSFLTPFRTALNEGGKDVARA